ncbi:MAG: 3-deoxy-manno-octulosonate cytidylyltransferase [Planctomycetes bacterium]|nr:3-deoxy-manno-octulosonate cytidylyltransferase [Planctomycetota bacterium]
MTKNSFHAAIIIPARLHSTRLPKKLLLDATGMPLICHTALNAARIRDRSDGLFTSVIVAADDESIVHAVNAFSHQRGLDIKAVMTRTDHNSGSDRIAEAAARLPDHVTAVLNLQGDEPDLPPEAVLGLADFFQTRRPDIATLVYPLRTVEDRENPALVKAVMGKDGRALYFSRADIPFRRDPAAQGPASLGHVGIYMYARAALDRFVALPQGELEQTEKLEQLRALENGMTIAAMILDQPPPKGIDTPEDYAAFVARNG